VDRTIPPTKTATSVKARIPAMISSLLTAGLFFIKPVLLFKLDALSN
jgi:hypothetical protein